MTVPRLFQCADWGGEVADLEDSQGHQIFKKVVINWEKPRVWERGEKAPIKSGDKDSCIYCLLRDHKSQRTKDRISYIGLTKNIHGRFYNHPTATVLANKRGETRLTVGSVDFGRYWRRDGTDLAMEQLEHILIWATWPEFNDRKVNQLPGMGKHPTKPWWILRTGYRFHGAIPREIVYPWMLVKRGRNRSVRS